MTAKIYWRDVYATGVQRIDHQHQYFIQMINWLAQSDETVKSSGFVHRHIEEVMKYASFHFFSEENLMRFNEYPERKFHAELHSKLIGKLDYKASLVEFGDIELSEFIDFLIDWFVDHTVVEDKKFGQFIAQKNNSK